MVKLFVVVKKCFFYFSHSKAFPSKWLRYLCIETLYWYNLNRFKVNIVSPCHVVMIYLMYILVWSMFVLKILSHLCQNCCESLKFFYILIKIQCGLQQSRSIESQNFFPHTPTIGSVLGRGGGLKLIFSKFGTTRKKT